MKNRVKRYQFIIFLALTFLISWFPWYMTGVGFLVFGPSAAGVLTIALVEGRSGLKDLTRRMLRWRAGLRWWAAAFFLPAVILLLSIGINYLLGGELSTCTFIRQEWYWLPLFFMMTFPGGPLGEEFGWRGFALPYLQKRLNPFIGSILLGFIWGMWHLPLFLQTGTLHSQIGIRLLPVYILGEIGLSILIAWIYNKSDGSLLVGAILLHNADNFWSSILITDETLSTVLHEGVQTQFNLQLYIIAVIVGLLAALLIAWRTKGTLGFKE